MPSLLFTPLQLRSVVFKNRIGVAPMCQYSCRDGLASNWHLVHLGSRAVGGAGMVMVEASAVSAAGRISPADLGIWSDAHAAALAPIAQFIAEQGAVPAIQLAHAGRKGSTQVPWQGRQAVPPEQGGWPVRAPSPVPFNDVYPLPAEMSEADIAQVVDDFAAAAQRSRAAGMQVVELHMGHGYLMHQFLSPLSNRRTDAYGGSFDGRARAPLRVAAAVREAWPRDLPLFVRLSATDWLEGGWDVAQSVELARRMKALGVDLVDCSSGSIVPGSQGQAVPGYQVPFADQIRREADIATAAVGLITQAAQAEEILRHGSADMVLLARELLRDPYWPLRAAAELDAQAEWPVQYLRAVSART
ncbi:NADH:flavin oxidoreductase/NADH oxidase [Bordetella petrii]|uniref:NADH:flavin oxidoreductase/NADH oxidase n=1 Tax=Bordetella petrii TaxID=94624 RepID=UPI001A973F2F|nr:NADH:flavin oxidoreductase/NADH oxidase [Bordetella petrii]MBO1110360.1 NADH:flavin oxidoreductase/NADH oxidase [Bordetella petrii]